MSPEQRARKFVEIGFCDLGVPSLEPYVKIIAELIAGAETELRAEIERLRAALQRIDGVNDNPACFNPMIDEVLRAALEPKP